MLYIEDEQEDFVYSESLAEEVNEILHETLYDLLDESLHNASSSILINM